MNPTQRLASCPDSGLAADVLKSAVADVPARSDQHGRSIFRRAALAGSVRAVCGKFGYSAQSVCGGRRYSPEVSAVGSAQVIHALAELDDDGWLIGEGWPRLAQQVLRGGLELPAVVDLADMDGATESEVSCKVAELRIQIEAHLGGCPPLEPWEVLVGLYGRAWRMGLIDCLMAIWRMYQIRVICYHELEADDSAAPRMFTWVVQVTDQDDGTLPLATVDALCTEVLEVADRLLAPDAVDIGLCRAIREVLDANGY